MDKNMELSEEHKKEIDHLILNADKNSSPNILFKQLIEISSKYIYKEDLSFIPNDKTIGYNPLTFEPIYK